MSDNHQKLHTLKSKLALQVERIATVQPGSWRTPTQTSTQRGYGYAWQQARARYLYDHPLCVMCESAGRVTAATVVDHSIPHRGDMTLFWQSGHWQALCKLHHDSEAQRRDRAAG